MTTQPKIPGVECLPIVDSLGRTWDAGHHACRNPALGPGWYIYARRQTTTKTRAVSDTLTRAGLNIPPGDVAALYRCERALQRWAERECGDGNDYASWAIERDETSGRPYLCTYPHRGDMWRVRVQDVERATLDRVTRICTRLQLHYYHQTDPRGVALYLARVPLNDSNYHSAGCPVC